MKKQLLLTIAVTFISFASFSQVVRVGLVGVGVGLTNNEDNGSLALHVAEVSYAPNPQMDFGIFFSTSIGATNSSAGATVDYGVQGRYFLREEGFKPYAGLQLGLGTGVSVDVIGQTADAGAKLRAIPQLGFRVGPLNIFASYNRGIMLNGGFVFGFGNFK